MSGQIRTDVGGGAGKQARVVFCAPPDFSETSSVFVEVVKAEPLSIKLLHDYPDMKPEVGWRVEAMGKSYEIKSASAGVFGCEEVKGAEAPQESGASQASGESSDAETSPEHSDEHPHRRRRHAPESES